MVAKAKNVLKVEKWTTPPSKMITIVAEQEIENGVIQGGHCWVGRGEKKTKRNVFKDLKLKSQTFKDFKQKNV